MTRMIHYFATDIAKEYGLAPAVIFQNIAYWIEHNRANETNFYEGDYWTYNSVRALTELFPYLTKKQISSSIQKLKNEGLIKTGNFNKSAYDRTMWYALTEKGKFIFQNGKMELHEKENEFCREGTPIPDINQDNKPILKNTDSEEGVSPESVFGKKRIDYQKIIDLYNTLCPSLPAVRSLSEARKNAIGARLKTYTVEDFRTVFENAQASSFLKGGNNRNWTANFDWLMKDANMAKVLDGNYRDRQGKSGSTGLQINRDDYDHGSQVPW